MTLTYKGKPTFQTVIGAIFTLGFLTIIGSSVINGYISVHNRQILSINAQSKFVDVSRPENALYPFKYGYRFAVGFLEPLDNKTGTFSVMYTTVTNGTNKKRQSILLGSVQNNWPELVS